MKPSEESYIYARTGKLVSLKEKLIGALFQRSDGLLEQQSERRNTPRDLQLEVSEIFEIPFEDAPEFIRGSFLSGILLATNSLSGLNTTQWKQLGYEAAIFKSYTPIVYIE